MAVDVVTIEAGNKYRMFTAIRPDIDRSGRLKYWIMRCDCGKEKSVRITNITYGNTQSCGCIRKIFWKKKY